MFAKTPAFRGACWQRAVKKGHCSWPWQSWRRFGQGSSQNAVLYIVKLCRNTNFCGSTSSNFWKLKTSPIYLFFFQLGTYLHYLRGVEFRFFQRLLQSGNAHRLSRPQPVRYWYFWPYNITAAHESAPRTSMWNLCLWCRFLLRQTKRRRASSLLVS